MGWEAESVDKFDTGKFVEGPGDKGTTGLSFSSRRGEWSKNTMKVQGKSDLVQFYLADKSIPIGKLKGDMVYWLACEFTAIDSENKDIGLFSSLIQRISPHSDADLCP